ncbi:SHC-transforming protein 1 [Lemmus lemmus]
MVRPRNSVADFAGSAWDEEEGEPADHQCYDDDDILGNEAPHEWAALVDPEGVVWTNDHCFESVSHLISYHVDDHLPIRSAGSELWLPQPEDRKV